MPQRAPSGVSAGRSYLIRAVVLGVPHVNTTLVVGSPIAPPSVLSSNPSTTAA